MFGPFHTHRLRQVDQGRLAGAIRSAVRIGAAAGERGDVHDRGGRAFLQHRQRAARQLQGALDIDLEGLAPAGQIGVDQRARRDDPGAVDQHVQPAPIGLDLRQRGVDVGLTANVHRDRDRRSALRLNICRHAIGHVGTQVRDNDLCAIGGKGMCDCFANPAATASDQCHHVLDCRGLHPIASQAVCIAVFGHRVVSGWFWSSHQRR